MPLDPTGRKRWSGFPIRETASQAEEDGQTTTESSAASTFPAGNENITIRGDDPSDGKMQDGIGRIQTCRLQMTDDYGEERREREEQNRIEEEGMTEISLEDYQNNESKIEGPRRPHSPSPFRGLLELGRENGMASSTFLEDSSRHFPDFQDPDLDEREEDSDYEILVHSDIWSDADNAVRFRAQRSRFPRPFQNIRTEVQEDNRPTPLNFDDFETLHISSNSSSPDSPCSEDWDGWFLSDTPQETYRFETKFPNAAPLLRKIYALPRNKKIELMTATAVVGCKEFADGLDKTIRMGRFVVNGVALNARDLKEMAEDRVLDWAPGLFEAMWNLTTGSLLKGD